VSPLITNGGSYRARVLLRGMPRPTFGPWTERRSRARVRRVAPKALALLDGGAGHWRLGAPLDGRGGTSVVAVDDGGGRRALLKVAGTRQGRRQLARQADVLAALHADDRLGRWARLLPRTLATGEVDGLAVVLESRLPGADPRRSGCGVDSVQVVPLALRALAELHARTAAVAPVDVGTVERWVRRPAARVRAVVRGRHRAALDRLEAELVAALAGRAVVRSWTHGDYNRTNVLFDGGAVSGVVDWSEAEPDGLVGADALTLLAWEHVLNGTELGAVVLRWLVEPGPVAEVVGSMQRDRGGEVVEMRTMLLLGWLRHVGANLTDSTRYAANPVWMHRNVRAVLRGLG
jgi:aminoglycoside phosphotransferase